MSTLEPRTRTGERVVEMRATARNRLIESRLTPNAISMTGLVLNVGAAVLVLEEEFFLGGIAFIIGSIMDTLDGRYSRMSGKGTPFGAFLGALVAALSALAASGALARARPDAWAFRTGLREAPV